MIDSLEINPRWYKNSYGAQGRPSYYDQQQKVEILTVKHESNKPSAVESNKPSVTESDLIMVKQNA